MLISIFIDGEHKLVTESQLLELWEGATIYDGAIYFPGTFTDFNVAALNATISVWEGVDDE